jgi:NDP-sugar pyrophosphorylase family protein
VRAFVLAGGLGTRLRPRFGDLPKGLAPIGGRPFLSLQLEWLAGQGLRDVVVCAGYGADQLREELGDGNRFGVKIEYSIEEQPLGTGGALHHARRFVDGPALVLNGDTMVECDPWALERERWETAALGAVALYEVAEAASRGRVESDAAGWITRFVEKDARHAGAARVNGGVYAFSPELWRRLPPAGLAPATGPPAFSLERDVLPALAAAHALRGVACAGEFFDIGTPEEWARAERRFTA